MGAGAARRGAGWVVPFLARGAKTVETRVF